MGIAQAISSIQRFEYPIPVKLFGRGIKIIFLKPYRPDIDAARRCVTPITDDDGAAGALLS
jgi:hypothetical protein